MDIKNSCECDPLKVGIRLVLKEYLRNKLRDKWKGSGAVDLDDIHLFYKSLVWGGVRGVGNLQNSDVDKDDKHVAVGKGMQLQWMMSCEDTLKVLVQWAEEKEGGNLEEDDGWDQKQLGYEWESFSDKVGNVWLSLDLNGGELTKEIIRWLVLGEEEEKEEGGEWRKCRNHSKFYKVGYHVV